jgi:ATP-dependent exoDNAse (exonuclease V) beta subunit
MSQHSRSIFIQENHPIAVALNQYYETNPYVNKYYKGVTKVLSLTKPQEDVDSLKKWRESIGEEKTEAILQESMSIGSSLDSIIERYLIDNRINYRDYKNEPGVKLFYQMKPVLDKINPIGMQIHMYSDKYKIQGYLDCVGFYKDKLVMIDFKNSRKTKSIENIRDYFLQCTIYILMIYEMTDILIQDIVIMIARRDSPTPQVETAKVIDYIKLAKERLKQYSQLK